MNSESSYKPISSRTTQHLVDADDMEWVHTDTHVERILARRLGDILVGADAGCFEGLGAQLFILIRDEMAAKGELVNRGTLSAEIEYPDLGRVSKYSSDVGWRQRPWGQGHHGCTGI